MRSTQLSRKCSVCGLAKPMAAFFLQKNDYGTICNDCRAKIAEGEDDSSSGGLRIDEKKKKHDELERKKHEEEASNLRRKDWDNLDKMATEVKDKREKTILSEKRHRDEYLDRKTPEKNLIDKKSTLTEAQKKLAAESGVLTEREAQEAGVQKETLETGERLKTGIDFTSPFTGQQVPQAKFHSAEFLKWIGTLTGNAPVKTFSTTHDPKAAQSNTAKTSPAVESKPVTTEPAKTSPTQQTTPVQQQQPTQQQSPPIPATPSFSSRVSFIAPPTQANKASTNTEPLFREIEKAWGPSSRKK